ncbi:MAG: hypothetical protein NTX52_13270 [Planctomycetota bacterium]|nr:hypothetical protein [Planctomycetota bacterium]
MIEPSGSSFDIMVELLLISLLAFMPLAFGVVHAWSEEIVIALSGAIVLCFLLKLVFHREQSLIWSWAYVPAGIFLLVVGLQLIPLPASLTNILSPNTVEVKTELLDDLPNAETALRSMTLSFYPNATKHDLWLVLAIAGVFVVALNTVRRPDQIKRLLMAIAIIGGIIATITLAQNIFGNGKIYWFISSQHTRGYSGPFVNLPLFKTVVGPDGNDESGCCNSFRLSNAGRYGCYAHRYHLYRTSGHCETVH